MPYALSRYSGSVMVQLLSQEFKESKVAFNSLWPRTIILANAVKNLISQSELI
jgi:hypothetical protein